MAGDGKRRPRAEEGNGRLYSVTEMPQQESARAQWCERKSTLSILVDGVQRPRVSEQWRLRNDTRNIVAYRCSMEGHVLRVLTPFEASIIPLFDGTNTIDDIRDACLRIYTPREDFRAQFSEEVDEILDKMMLLEGFLVLDGDMSPSLRGSLTHLLPDFPDYHFPAPRLERPLSVMIAFTNRCTCSCRYCYAERRDCRESDVDQWIPVFDELAENEIFLVDIAGGDIFAREDALEILGEMVSRDFTFFLSTKSLISLDEAERLASMGVGVLDVPRYLRRRVQVSIDSADKDTASFLVRHPGYFERATQTVMNLLRAGISPRLKCVLTSYNAEAPQELVPYFADVGVTAFDFVYYTKSYYRHEDALFLSAQQKLRLHEIFEELKSDYPSLELTFQDETTTKKPLTMSCEQWDLRAVCSGGRSNMILQPNGDVTLCDQVPHRDPFVVGNVFEQGVMEVWKSPRLLAFLYPERERFEGTVCFDCSQFDGCIGPDGLRGYCYRDALFYYGSIYDAPPECPWQNKPTPRKA
jgi:radical SAM protein with 4Fe4S-binding SPASM domain